ncbi:protein Brevis radix-like 4 isoform X2 [Rutidosis leptorrhynchoides]|uniref:protein Brevis radix-like 4 isoform X2 n=1 Tax=Rutidosis leptorrhynchoides TaxID=125765 RepID=UPI003A9939C2
MLTCVPRSKQPNDDDESNRNGDTLAAGKQPMKRFGSQIKYMALKASGAYRSCTPCTAHPSMMMMTSPQKQLQKSNDAESESSASVSELFRWSYRQTGSKNSSSGRVWGKEMEARIKGISIGDMTAGTLSVSGSCGIDPPPVVLIQEIEPKKWVAQVEPGVLITFISLPRGGNDLKQIRFSREMFNQWQAQRWWQQNFEKVMELYNVQKLINRQAFHPLPTTLKSEHDTAQLDSRSLKFESIGNNPLKQTLSKERQLENQDSTLMSSDYDSSTLTATPKVSSISGTKTETSSSSSSSSSIIDASATSASSSKEVEADQSGERSISNVSDVDNEWVEEDEPGVYITIRLVPGGSKELRRVRFRSCSYYDSNRHVKCM